MDHGNKLKWIIGTHGNWKTANTAYSPRKWAKWAKLVVLFSWQLQNGPQDFDFFLIVMGANYSFELIYIVHWVPQFFMHT